MRILPLALAAILALPLPADLSENLEHMLSPTPTEVSAHGSLNNPSCTPSSEHPTPVVFIHGTAGNMDYFSYGADYLASQGYCVYSINYGRDNATILRLWPDDFATGDVFRSTDEIAAFVDDVRARTGSDKVDLVGHSQGGMQIKSYISRLGNGDKVRRVVVMGGNIHGVPLDDSLQSQLIRYFPDAAALVAGRATVQQFAGSEQMNELNSYPDTVAGITYTSLFSPHDTTVAPNDVSYFAPESGANVVNLDAEVACPGSRPIAHENMPETPAMIKLTQWGLERAKDETEPPAGVC